MTMAALDTTAETARPSFVRLREVRDALRSRTGLGSHRLSMGMSNDFETAVEEGATLVRVGSALFEESCRIELSPHAAGTVVPVRAQPGARRNASSASAPGRAGRHLGCA